MEPKWQSIETAPTDFTVFMVAWPHSQMDGGWFFDFWAGKHLLDVRKAYDEGLDKLSPHMWQMPTHWQPLPAAPDATNTHPPAMPVARKQFPILGSRGAKIDLQLVEDHGKQAYSNHYQTVERLAERGGLSWCELHAVLNNRAWQKVDENTAITECRAIEARYLGAFDPPATDVAALVEALVAHNDALRSASQVAYRDGKDTNWLTFRGAITYTLAEHHDTVNAARQALAPFTKGQNDDAVR